MKPLALLASAIAATTMRPTAAAPFSCPQAAPLSWNLPAARLDSVRVLSYPANQPPVDGGALPTLAPIREWKRAGTLYQRWNINFDAPTICFKWTVCMPVPNATYAWICRESNSAPQPFNSERR